MIEKGRPAHSSGAKRCRAMAERKTKPRPRDYVTLDVDFFTQDTIQDLIHEFGPAGPAVFLAIILAAKRATKGGLPPEKHGTVSLRYRAVARSTGVSDVEDVRRIVDAAVSLGLLVRIDDQTGDDEHFTVHLAKRDRWEAKTGAERMAKLRARP